MKSKKLLLTLATALLTSIGAAAQGGEAINVERMVGQGYGAQEVTVDFTAAKEYLGVETLSTDMLRIVNPDNTEISDYAPYDGWFTKEGKAESWGTNTFTCVKFWQAIPDGKFNICDMNDPAVGDKFSCRWALTTNSKTYTYTINVTYIAQQDVELTASELAITAAVEYATTEASYTEKTVSLTDEQVSSICTELGISALSEAKVYGYNPTTKELVAAYSGYDGWRDASGDFAKWTGDASVPACVKYDDGKTYYCYNIYGCESQTIKTYWAIANSEKYVLVEIDFTYANIRTVSTTGWMTTCFGEGVAIPDGAKAYYASALTGNTVTLAELEGAIPANEAVIINAKPGVYTFTAAEASAISGNLLMTYSAWTEVAADNIYVLGTIGTNTVGFLLYAGGWFAPAKAYLPKPADGARTLCVVFSGETTGISDINGSSTANGKIYDLSGRRVKEAAKGLYIVNGKKMVIK